MEKLFEITWNSLALISVGFNSPRLASIFEGKFENGWYSFNQKLSSSKCLAGLPRGLFTQILVFIPDK